MVKTEGVRVDQESVERLKALALVVSRDAWRRIVEFRKNGHRFDTRSTPVFDGASTGTYRTIDFTSSTEKGASERYAAIFGRKADYSTKVLYSELDGADEYEAFMDGWPRLVDFRSLDSSIRVDVFELPVKIAERVVHLSGGDALDESLFESTCRELLYFWLHEELPVEMVLPILGVSFDDDALELSDGCRVERLSDGEQLARWPQQRRRELDDAALMATHALVVPGWTMTVDKWFIWMRVAEEPNEDVEQAKTFFQALAMITDAPSGYAQILTRPKGWANTYQGTLPPLRASDFTTQFSKRLARGGLEPAATLSSQDSDLLVACYSSLSGTAAPLAIAAHRLLRSEMRTDIEFSDVILDLCIGIESLLSDGPVDMTYKLGIRAAAVLGAQGWEQPSAYVEAVKKIYDRRSAVVHGRGKEGKSATIAAAGKEWNAEDLARRILRELMLARHHNPSLDAKAIDTQLVRPALDAFYGGAGGYSR
ncbi:HEPN domain-containing protein [Pseudarthrobacter phenanthrenivorans]|uniref:HEPN domain-containing protein n=1 Tax=Pseudarthrobacter phenanthrenivorans TaxID=361575 RepID=UPI00112AA8AC|nr:HEPN domain-containing protein [Pseudarthrobacter phenanthrenivorans]